MMDGIRQWLLGILAAAMGLSLLYALLPKGAVRAAAKAAGQSVQAYVLQACEERMKREGRPLELDSPADE